MQGRVVDKPDPIVRAIFMSHAVDQVEISIFEYVASNYGGAIDYNGSDDALLGILQRASERFAQYAKIWTDNGLYHSDYLPVIHGFSNTKTVDAVADIVGNRDIIVITYGLADSLAAAVFNVKNQAENFTVAMLPALEATNPTESTIKFIENRRAAPNGCADFSPISDQGFLYHRMLDFVFWHELGHINNGHTTWLYNCTRFSRLSEFNMVSDRIGNLDRQTLEMDADVFAIKFLVRNEIEHFNQGVSKGFFSDVYDIVFFYSFMIALLFFLVEEWEGSSKIGEFTQTHPPPTVRYLSCIGAMQLVLRDFGEYDPEIIRDISATASVLVESIAASAGALKRPAFDVSRAVSFLDASAHGLVLLRHWANMRPQLEPFVRAGSLPTVAQ